MVNYGLTVSDVRAIAEAEVFRVVGELSASAQEVAKTRINSLYERLIGQLGDRPELFAAFAEPDFQYSLSDAARVAASSDEAHIEQLLVDLLVSRAAERNGARVRLATSQAIRAADKLSEEALNGLTAIWAIGQLDVNIPSVASKLETAEEIATKLLALDLPSDHGWVSDADVLNLVRVAPEALTERLKYFELFRFRVKGRLVPGLDRDDDDVQKMLNQALERVPQLRDLISPHDLKPGFLVLAGESRDDLLSQLPADLNPPSELDWLIEHNGYGTVDSGAIDHLETLLNDSPAIAEMAKWWDAVPQANFTVVGDTVGFVNASRYLEIRNIKSVAELLTFRVSGG